MFSPASGVMYVAVDKIQKKSELKDERKNWTFNLFRNNSCERKVILQDGKKEEEEDSKKGVWQLQLLKSAKI